VYLVVSGSAFLIIKKAFPVHAEVHCRLSGVPVTRFFCYMHAVDHPISLVKNGTPEPIRPTVPGFLGCRGATMYAYDCITLL
jgi:hypothetical protein